MQKQIVAIWVTLVRVPWAWGLFSGCLTVLIGLLALAGILALQRTGPEAIIASLPPSSINARGGGGDGNLSPDRMPTSLAAPGADSAGEDPLSPQLDPAVEVSPLSATLEPPTPTPTLYPQTPTTTPRPVFAGPLVIGHSVEGRPLEVYRIGTGDEARLIVAGIHGGYEWNTIALAEALIVYLKNRPDTVPPGVRLYILRALNPDGLAYDKGYAGRANANGVDLNRNWPAHWAETWSREHCWNNLPITAGPYPASEPETQALMTFIQEQDIAAMMSYHSAALGIFPGGVPPFQPSIDLAEAIAAVTDYPYPPWGGGCVYTGNLVDWAAEQGIPSVDVELHTHREIDYEINLRVLEVFLNWKQK